MRILLIRHGDPDYKHDCLTEVGKKEAALFAEAAKELGVGDCYVSPLGRAQDTAAYTLQRLGISAKTLDWLQEFPLVCRFFDSNSRVREYDSTVKGRKI